MSHESSKTGNILDRPTADDLGHALTSTFLPPLESSPSNVAQIPETLNLPLFSAEEDLLAQADLMKLPFANSMRDFHPETSLDSISIHDFDPDKNDGHRMARHTMLELNQQLHGLKAEAFEYARRHGLGEDWVEAHIANAKEQIYRTLPDLRNAVSYAARVIDTEDILRLRQLERKITAESAFQGVRNEDLHTTDALLLDQYDLGQLITFAQRIGKIKHVLPVDEFLTDAQRELLSKKFPSIVKFCKSQLELRRTIPDLPDPQWARIGVEKKHPKNSMGQTSTGHQRSNVRSYEEAANQDTGPVEVNVKSIAGQVATNRSRVTLDDTPHIPVTTAEHPTTSRRSRIGRAVRKMHSKISGVSAPNHTRPENKNQKTRPRIASIGVLALLGLLNGSTAPHSEHSQKSATLNSLQSVGAVPVNALNSIGSKVSITIAEDGAKTTSATIGSIQSVGESVLIEPILDNVGRTADIKPPVAHPKV